MKDLKVDVKDGDGVANPWRVCKVMLEVRTDCLPYVRVYQGRKSEK